MSAIDPRRLRANSDLPSALRSALRARPSEDPSVAQLAALRGRLGLRVAHDDFVASDPASALVAQSQRLRSRRLARTAAALVFFPVAAAAALGAAFEVAERFTSSPAASSAVSVSKSVQRSGRAASAPVAGSAHLEQPPPVHTAELEHPASALPSARAASDAVRLPPVVEVGPAVAGPSEVDLLQRANADLKTQPVRALALTAQHRAAFPSGNLSQERDVITVKAWLALGNLERAREALASFEQTYPHSAYALELRQAVR